eukprot:258180-Amorphochlora_amoeboformis.AAC.1
MGHTSARTPCRPTAILKPPERKRPIFLVAFMISIVYLSYIHPPYLTRGDGGRIRGNKTIFRGRRSIFRRLRGGLGGGRGRDGEEDGGGGGERLSLVEIEENVLRNWQEKKVFEAQMERFGS